MSARAEKEKSALESLGARDCSRGPAVATTNGGREDAEMKLKRNRRSRIGSENKNARAASHVGKGGGGAMAGALCTWTAGR